MSTPCNLYQILFICINIYARITYFAYMQNNTIQYFIDTPYRGFSSDNKERLKRVKSHAVELKER